MQQNKVLPAWLWCHSVHSACMAIGIMGMGSNTMFGRSVHALTAFHWIIDTLHQHHHKTCISELSLLNTNRKHHFDITHSPNPNANANNKIRRRVHSSHRS